MAYDVHNVDLVYDLFHALLGPVRFIDWPCGGAHDGDPIWMDQEYRVEAPMEEGALPPYKIHFFPPVHKKLQLNTDVVQTSAVNGQPERSQYTDRLVRPWPWWFY